MIEEFLTNVPYYVQLLSFAPKRDKDAPGKVGRKIQAILKAVKQKSMGIYKISVAPGHPTSYLNG
jgi:hypothetical protein